MSMRNDQALPLPSQRRNRRILAIAAATLAPVVAIAATLFVAQDPHPQPLLAIGAVSISPEAAPAAAAPRKSIPPVVVQDFPLPVEEAVEASASDSNTRWFNGRPLRPAHTMMMTVTAYSPDERSCAGSADGITASGYSVYTNGMKLVAADTNVLPFGSLITVPGYDSGNIVPVLDRGGAIKGTRLDLLFPTHEQARKFGVKKVQVTVWEYADGQPHDYVPIYKANASVVARKFEQPAG